MHFWILNYNNCKLKLGFVWLIDSNSVPRPRRSSALDGGWRIMWGEFGISTLTAASLAVNIRLFNLLQFPGEWRWTTLILSLSCISPPCSLVPLAFYAPFLLCGLNVISVLPFSMLGKIHLIPYWREEQPKSRFGATSDLKEIPLWCQFTFLLFFSIYRF